MLTLQRHNIDAGKVNVNMLIYMCLCFKFSGRKRLGYILQQVSWNVWNCHFLRRFNKFTLTLGLLFGRGIKSITQNEWHCVNDTFLIRSFVEHKVISRCRYLFWVLAALSGKPRLMWIRLMWIRFSHLHKTILHACEKKGRNIVSFCSRHKLSSHCAEHWNSDSG